MSQASPYLSVELRVEDEPAPGDVALLNDRLYRHNAAITGCDNGRGLTILVRDEAREIVAGLHGWTWGPDRLRADALGPRGPAWPRARAKLLATAEVEAARRGCREVHLDTHSYQAPDFYRHRGYEVIGELPGWPGETTSIFLWKPLPDL